MDLVNRQQLCNVCRQEYTSIHSEVAPGVFVYVCSNCLEAAKHNFIWICTNCGRSYVRPKKLVLERLNNFELKRAYLQCEDMQIIQGIDMCIECDPEGIFEYMEVQKTAMVC
jgi:predicted amidophosphoribosyltransferase